MGVKPKPQREQPVKAGGSKAVKSKTAWSWREKDLKKKIPLVQGSTITEVKNLHTHTWTGRYKSAPAGWQKTFSRTVTVARTSEVAAKLVFDWLWAVHAEATGNRMPADCEHPAA
eukprot:1162620-Amphidinium_carterae.1